jgi:hypothetical protein
VRPCKLTLRYLIRQLLIVHPRSALLIGFQLLALVVNLPQRFQVINEQGATDAGMRLLPMILFVPFASAIAQKSGAFPSPTSRLLVVSSLLSVKA